MLRYCDYFLGGCSGDWRSVLLHWSWLAVSFSFNPPITIPCEFLMQNCYGKMTRHPNYTRINRGSFELHKKSTSILLGFLSVRREYVT